MENHSHLGKRTRAEITFTTPLGGRHCAPRIAMARAEAPRKRSTDCQPPTEEETNAGSAVAMEVAMNFFSMMTDRAKFCRLLPRLWQRRGRECLALWRSRRGARPERGTAPLAPTIYKAPATVREPPLWTGRYGCLNAGFGWANEAVKDRRSASRYRRRDPCITCRPLLRLRCRRSTRGQLSNQ